MPVHGRSRGFMFQNHHILLQHFADHPVVRLLRSRFELDATRHRMNLPSKQGPAAELNVSPHTGGHLGTYFKGFGDYLNDLERSPKYAAALAGDTRELDAIASDVSALVAAAKYALANGHLFANTAEGMTPEEANVLNKQWFENWRKYAEKNRTPIQQMQETVDQLLAAGRADAALHFPLLSPTRDLSMAERIEILKRITGSSPISLQFTNVGPFPDLPSLVPPFLDTRLPGFISPRLDGLNEQEGFARSDPRFTRVLPPFPTLDPDEQQIGRLPPSTVAPSDQLVLKSDPHSGVTYPYYENPLAGGAAPERDVLPYLAAVTAFGLAAPFAFPWLLGIIAASQFANAHESSPGGTKSVVSSGGGVFSTGGPAPSTSSNGLGVDNASGTNDVSASSTFRQQQSEASSSYPETRVSTFADRFGNWANTPDGSVLAEPTNADKVADAPARGSIAPENVRRLAKVNEANAGSVFTSGSTPVPFQPSTEFNERFGNWTAPIAYSGQPQPGRPTGAFAEEPGYLIPPPIFGVDGRGYSHNDAEEWFSRWIRPLLPPE